MWPIERVLKLLGVIFILCPLLVLLLTMGPIIHDRGRRSSAKWEGTIFWPRVAVARKVLRLSEKQATAGRVVHRSDTCGSGRSASSMFFFARSQYERFNSDPTARRPMLRADTSSDPMPANGVATRSPGLLHR